MCRMLQSACYGCYLICQTIVMEASHGYIIAVLYMEKRVFQLFHSKGLHENYRRKLNENWFICMLSISAECSYEGAEVIECMGQIWGNLNVPLMLTLGSDLNLSSLVSLHFIVALHAN